MESQQIIIYGLIALFAGYVGWTAFEDTSFAAAFIVLFSATWVLYRLTSLEGVWDFLGQLTSPPVAAMVALFLGASYFVMEGHLFPESMTFGLGTALIGGAAGMLLWKYWNIGA